MDESSRAAFGSIGYFTGKDRERCGADKCSRTGLFLAIEDFGERNACYVVGPYLFCLIFKPSDIRRALAGYGHNIVRDAARCRVDGGGDRRVLSRAHMGCARI